MTTTNYVHYFLVLIAMAAAAGAAAAATATGAREQAGVHQPNMKIFCHSINQYFWNQELIIFFCCCRRWMKKCDETTMGTARKNFGVLFVG